MPSFHIPYIAHSTALSHSHQSHLCNNRSLVTCDTTPVWSRRVSRAWHMSYVSIVFVVSGDLSVRPVFCFLPALLCLASLLVSFDFHKCFITLHIQSPISRLCSPHPISLCLCYYPLPPSSIKFQTQSTRSRATTLANTVHYLCKQKTWIIKPTHATAQLRICPLPQSLKYKKHKSKKQKA